MTTTDLLARREKLLGTGTPLFYQEAVNIVRGEGVWLFDPDGRRYLDMYNNVPCVGHCHPHVVKAMHRQARPRSTSTAAICTKASSITQNA